MRSAILVIVSLFILRRSRLMATYCSIVVPAGLKSLAPSPARTAGTTRARNLSSSGIVLFLNGFGNVRWSKSLVASSPVGSRANSFIGTFTDWS